MAAAFTTDTSDRFTETGRTFARVLVPIDFSPGSRHALATALSLHRHFGSQVHLFHVTRPGAEADSIHAGDKVLDTESRLLRLVEDQFPEHAADVAVHARIGVDVAEEIARRAIETRATMVLLAARQKHSLLRTQVEKTMRALGCPVMVLWSAGAREPS